MSGQESSVDGADVDRAEIALEQEQDRLADRQRKQAHDQRRQQPPHQIPVAEIADHRAADRHQHDMQRAAARPGEAPDRAAAQAVERPGLRAAEHRHAGDADGEDAELDVKKPGSDEHNGLQNGQQQEKRAVERPHERIFIGRVHGAPPFLSWGHCRSYCVMMAICSSLPRSHDGSSVAYFATPVSSRLAFVM